MVRVKIEEELKEDERMRVGVKSTGSEEQRLMIKPFIYERRDWMARAQQAQRPPLHCKEAEYPL